MEGPISSEKYTLPKFAKGLQVVLVDHDLKSLTKIMGKLMKFSFQVTPVNLASTALSMIRKNKTCYDLVAADINLQDMDHRSFGHELCQTEIPLIWMLPSDDRAAEALLYGYYIKKPISSNDLKYLFQHAFRRRSNQKESHGIEIREAGGASGSAANLGIQNRQVVQKEQKRLIDDQRGNMQDKRIRYGNAKRNERGRRGDGNRNAKRRARRVWTPERQSKFEAAISELGDRANPTSICEKMNDPSITPKQVASHLQKFKSSAQKKNVGSGATSLPVTNNSSSSQARHPGEKNLPNFHPCANQNQDLDINFAASICSRFKNQLPAGFATTTELFGSAQARITSGIVTNPDKFPSNSSDGIQNPKPMVELGPADGFPNIPPHANQNQDLTTNFVATCNSNCKNQLPAGVATTEPLGFEQANIITSGIATNSENAPTDFTDGMQNLQPIVERAPAAGSSRRLAFGNQNQDLNTIREAPFSTRHQSQLPEGGVGIQNQEPMVEQALAVGSSNHNQSLSEFAIIFNEDETVDLESILNSQNPGDIEQNQEPMGEQAPAAVSSYHGLSSRDSEEADGFINMERFESCHGVYGEGTDM